ANISDVDAEGLPSWNFKRIQLRSKYINRKFKRDTTSTGLVDMLQDVMYVATVTIGTPPRIFDVVIDTGSADLWIPDSSCVGTGCSGKHTFAANYSLSYGGDGGSWQITYVDQSGASGVTSSETVIVGGFILKNQKFARATRMNDGFQGLPADGIIGLAGPQDAVIPGTVTPIQNMKNQGYITSRSFGVWLGKSSNGGSGEITFGGFDPSHIDGNLTTIPLASRSFDSVGIWVVQMNQISVGSRVFFLGPKEGFTVVDTGTSLIAAPTIIADQINKLFNGTFSAQAQAYILDCNAKLPDLSFSFGNASFTVPGADLVVDAGQGLCISAILPIDIGGGLSFLVGDTFLKSNYAYFDLDSSSIG
ncbi:2642_t:CDS:2, partial [Paraglomus occultum]